MHDYACVPIKVYKNRWPSGFGPWALVCQALPYDKILSIILFIRILHLVVHICLLLTWFGH